MEHLIECVRRYPCLWNTTAIEYRDQELKDAAWTEVMKETELSSVKEVKLKWKKLRDSYRDALKRQSETAAQGGGKRGSAWKYTGQMQFLQPYMNNRKKVTEAPVAPPTPPAALTENGHQHGSEPEPEPESEDEDSESSCAPPAPAPAPPPPAPVQLPVSLGVPAAGRKRASSPDPIETFFTGMCQATRRLPFPAQLRIKRALFEAVAAGEEALLADHHRYAAAAAAAAVAARAGAAPPRTLLDSSSSEEDAGDA